MHSITWVHLDTGSYCNTCQLYNENKMLNKDLTANLLNAECHVLDCLAYKQDDNMDNFNWACS